MTETAKPLLSTQTKPQQLSALKARLEDYRAGRFVTNDPEYEARVEAKIAALEARGVKPVKAKI